MLWFLRHSLTYVKRRKSPIFTKSVNQAYEPEATPTCKSLAVETGCNILSRKFTRKSAQNLFNNCHVPNSSIGIWSLLDLGERVRTARSCDIV